MNAVPLLREEGVNNQIFSLDRRSSLALSEGAASGVWRKGGRTTCLNAGQASQSSQSTLQDPTGDP